MPVVAVDCGGTNLSVARLERATDPVEPVVVATPSEAGDIPVAITELAGELGGGESIGVAIAGLVDAGNLVWMPHRDGGAEIARPLSAALGARVEVDNDANCACLAEATVGAGAGHRMVLTVTVGTGIGGGLVIDGRIERGRGFLGEIGHTSLEIEGPMCSCGKRGCWEAFASGSAMDRAAAEVAGAEPEGHVAAAAGASQPSGSHLVAAVRAGDRSAARAFGEIAMHFGRGLANMVVVFDPDVIVVGGGAGSIGELLLEPARREMVSRVAGAGHRRPTPVVSAALGPNAGLVGAALLAGAPA
ncbi:MAG TPA: ROK family protein [Acidimicrobiia bacterium]|nr:ROK family protein [Acidimicrobiia bacterium]